MWISHLMLFLGTRVVDMDWVGDCDDNIVGSLFNSFIFDFTEGWLYVIGFGVVGGHGLKAAAPVHGPSGHVRRPLDLPPRPRILVIGLRRLGDVLLTTPLIRSLRRAWPDAMIDALVFADTAGILNGNPDLNGIVAMPAPPTVVQSLALAARLFRKYDLAISTQPGDRPIFFAFMAGRVRVGLVASEILQPLEASRILPRPAGRAWPASRRREFAAGRSARYRACA